VMGVTRRIGTNIRYFWTSDFDTATFANASTSYATNWNLLSLPRQPKNPDPAEIHGEVWDIDYRLYAFDDRTQSTIVYDMWSPQFFGAMSASQGYWFNSMYPGSMSYQGYADSGIDRWISARQGWKIIGNPFTYSTMWEDWKATDGTQTLGIEDASQWGAGWLQSIIYGFDESIQSSYDVGIFWDFAQREHLQSGHGFWLKTSKDVGLFAPAQ